MIQIGTGHARSSVRSAGVCDCGRRAKQEGKELAINSRSGEQWNQLGSAPAFVIRERNFVQVGTQLAVKHVSGVESKCRANACACILRGMSAEDAARLRFDLFQPEIRQKVGFIAACSDHFTVLNANPSKRRPHAANNLSFVLTNSAAGSPNN